MIREKRNYILISLGFGLIMLFTLVHLFGVIDILLQDYNGFIRGINTIYNASYSEQTVLFFGDGVNSVIFIIDILIILIVLNIMLIIGLSVMWSIKYEKR